MGVCERGGDQRFKDGGFIFRQGIEACYSIYFAKEELKMSWTMVARMNGRSMDHYVVADQFAVSSPLLHLHAALALPLMLSSCEVFGGLSRWPLRRDICLRNLLANV